MENIIGFLVLGLSIAFCVWISILGNKKRKRSKGFDDDGDYDSDDSDDGDDD